MKAFLVKIHKTFSQILTHLVKFGVCAPSKKAVELKKRINRLSRPEAKETHLNEQEQVGILTLGRCPITLLNVVGLDVDSLWECVFQRLHTDDDDKELTIVVLRFA